MSERKKLSDDPKAAEIIDKVLRYGELAQRTSPSTQCGMRALYFHYRQIVSSGGVLPRIEDTGFRVFSGFDEDGILLYILSVLGFGPRLFVDLGSGDGISGSNTANLALNLGFHGVFIDGNREAIERGERYYHHHPATNLYPPKFCCERVTKGNVNDIVARNGFKGEIDVLSIDMDGNDYWIWEALDIVSPRVVVTESHIEYGERSIVVPYDEDFEYPGVHEDYFGASVTAMTSLAKEKGYRLIGANRFGFNTFFVREDLASSELPEINPGDVLRHPRTLERSDRFNKVKHFAFVEV